MAGQVYPPQHKFVRQMILDPKVTQIYKAVIDGNTVLVILFTTSNRPQYARDLVIGHKGVRIVDVGRRPWDTVTLYTFRGRQRSLRRIYSIY